LLDPPRFERKRHQDAIVNSRNAHRNAQALAGFRAFVRALPPCAGLLSLGQTAKHRESEDARDPGGSRV